MHKTSLYYSIKISSENRNIVTLFFKDWADGICENNIIYQIVAHNSNDYIQPNEIIRADFDNEEDALALKLRGIPDDLKDYIILVSLDR